MPFSSVYILTLSRKKTREQCKNERRKKQRDWVRNWKPNKVLLKATEQQSCIIEAAATTTTIALPLSISSSAMQKLTFQVFEIRWTNITYSNALYFAIVCVRELWSNCVVCRFSVRSVFSLLNVQEFWFCTLRSTLQFPFRHSFFKLTSKRINTYVKSSLSHLWISHLKLGKKDAVKNEFYAIWIGRFSSDFYLKREFIIWKYTLIEWVYAIWIPQNESLTWFTRFKFDLHLRSVRNSTFDLCYSSVEKIHYCKLANNGTHKIFELFTCFRILTLKTFNQSWRLRYV